MAIVRTQGILEVPEVFDVYKMMEGYAPMMHQLGILESGLDNKETEFVLGLFKNANYDTPAIIDCEGTRISTKLKSQYIKGGYEALEDCLDDEITVLYKVTAVRTEGNVVIFDPMKDFIKLNRALRRSMERKNPGLSSSFETISRTERKDKATDRQLIEFIFSGFATIEWK